MQISKLGENKVIIIISSLGEKRQAFLSKESRYSFFSLYFIKLKSIHLTGSKKDQRCYRSKFP